jgi:hypothetical protein
MMALLSFYLMAAGLAAGVAAWSSECLPDSLLGLCSAVVSETMQNLFSSS